MISKLALFREEDVGYVPDSYIQGDSLIIDCRGCGYVPLPGSPECIRCMVSSMCRTGSAERVVLRTGKDTEISGRAGKVLKDVASLRRWSMPVREPRGRCRTCPVSRSEVMRLAWERFPEGMAGTMPSEVPERDECRECVATTCKTLEQLSSEIGRVERRMSGYRRVLP